MASEKSAKIDEKDRSIITELIHNSRQTVGRISRKVGLPITTVHNRLKKLEKNQVITNYTVNLNYEKLGRPIMAYIGVTINYKIEGKNIRQADVAKRIKSLEGVREVTILTGGTDVLVKVLAKDIPDLNNLVTDKLRNIGGIDKTQTMIVLQQV